MNSRKDKEMKLLVIAKKIFKNKKLSINDTPEKVKNWEENEISIDDITYSKDLFINSSRYILDMNNNSI